MNSEPNLVVRKQIAARILTLRGEKVMLDAHLAQLYGVPTKVLNQAVKRNATRFPEDFMFQVTVEEWGELNRSQTVTGSQRHRDPRFMPWAFTEHGALMAANILNSPRAAEMSVYVIRAFIQMRREMVMHEVLGRRLAEIEKVLLGHGVALRDLYQKIRPLLLPPPKPTQREIGFHVKPDAPGGTKGRKP